MERLRNRLKNGWGACGITGLCALLASTSACRTAPEVKAEAPQATAPRYSGEQLFRGIYFGEGPVATQLPQFAERRRKAELDLNDKAAMAIRLRQVSAEIRATGGGDKLAAHFDALAKQADTSKLFLEDSSKVTAAAHVASRQEQTMRSIRARDPLYFERFAQDVQSGDHLKVEQAYTDGRKLIDTITTEDLNDVFGGEGTKVAAPWLQWEVAVASYVVIIFFVVISQIDVTPVVGNPKTRLALEMTVNDIATRLAVKDGV